MRPHALVAAKYEWFLLHRVMKQEGVRFPFKALEVDLLHALHRLPEQQDHPVEHRIDQPQFDVGEGTLEVERLRFSTTEESIDDRVQDRRIHFEDDVSLEWFAGQQVEGGWNRQ